MLRQRRLVERQHLIAWLGAAVAMRQGLQEAARSCGEVVTSFPDRNLVPDAELRGANIILVCSKGGDASQVSDTESATNPKASPVLQLRLKKECALSGWPIRR